MAAIRPIKRKNGTSYEVRIHRGKGLSMSKSFPSKQAAREWANTIEAKLDKGLTVSRKAAGVKFTEACADFLAYYRPPKGGDIPENKRQLVSAVADEKTLKKLTIDKITHEVLQKFMDEMLKAKISEPAEKKKTHPLYNGSKRRNYSQSTVRKHFYAIKQILEWHSIREKYSLDESLFRNLIIPAPWDGKRNRRLADGEIEKIEKSAKTGYANKNEWLLLIGFALATAARSQEILKAEWSEVNKSGRAWNIPEHHVKTSTFRQVPLSKKALEILDDLKKLKKDGEDRIFYFWKDSSTVSKGWRRLCARAGVENFRFHDLRHEAISRLFERTTLSDIEIMATTGHTNPTTLKGYAHLRSSYLAEKMDAIA